MPQFEFRTNGVTKERLRRWRKWTRQPVSTAVVLPAAVIVLIASYAAGTLGPVRLDQYGNPIGDRHDLVRDYSFQGALIAVLHLYTGEGFNFAEPEQALRKKGFQIQRWTEPPTAQELARVLETASQLWVISTHTRKLNDDHLKVIKEFFNKGGGLYLWGDNNPYYADANYVGNELFRSTMAGDVDGNRIIGRQALSDGPGFKTHPIMSGIERLYEGNTIATIQGGSELEPLFYGSEGNLVAAVYDSDGKRAVVDGGSTRLFVNWGAAGGARYVQNAAAWLVNP